MAHFLFRASYSQDGLQGLLKEGAKSRVKVLTETVASVGGKLEAMYWSFGDEDVILVAELPDNSAAAALSTRVAATGVASVSTTVLLTAAEVDKARKLKAAYRPPGS
ncbi:MAG: GYD domain-containing protein [Chloroflexi bacterium]|nr:GYD domain-containing protein [Chloroflexota bacterium]